MVNGPPQHAQTEAFSAAMAGILIYTAAPDSEGTLGGLVSLGQTATLEQHLDQALESLEICSSDPLCAEAQPEQEYTSLRVSARHTCKRSASAQPLLVHPGVRWLVCSGFGFRFPPGSLAFGVLRLDPALVGRKADRFSPLLNLVKPALRLCSVPKAR